MIIKTLTDNQYAIINYFLEHENKGLPITKLCKRVFGEEQCKSAKRGAKGNMWDNVNKICTVFPKKDFRIFDEGKLKEEDYKRCYWLKVNQEVFIWLSSKYLITKYKFTFIKSEYTKLCINELLCEYILERLLKETYNKIDIKDRIKIINHKSDLIKEIKDSPTTLYWCLFGTEYKISPKTNINDFFNKVKEMCYSYNIMDHLGHPDEFNN